MNFKNQAFILLMTLSSSLATFSMDHYPNTLKYGGTLIRRQMNANQIYLNNQLNKLIKNEDRVDLGKEYDLGALGKYTVAEHIITEEGQDQNKDGCYFIKQLMSFELIQKSPLFENRIIRFKFIENIFVEPNQQAHTSRILIKAEGPYWTQLYDEKKSYN